MHYYLTSTLLSVLFFVSCISGLSAQPDTLKQPRQYEGMAFTEFASQIQANYPLRLFFHPDSIEDFSVRLQHKPLPVAEQLGIVLRKQGLYLHTDRQGSYFITSGPHFPLGLPGAFFKVEGVSMRDHGAGDDAYEIPQAVYTSNTRVVGKRNTDKKGMANISGYVRNGSTNAPITGATLWVKDAGVSTVTDENGFYALTLPAGTYTLELRSMESEKKEFKLKVYSDGSLNFYPERKEVALDEVRVVSERFHNVRSTQMGFEKISTRNIEQIPVALGEPDIVKVSLLLPGIQTVGEGTAGFNVRGSPIDQNVFYLSQMPVYNTSHFLGFFSAFNSDAVKDFTLYKSSIPAQYGGRLASVFDIKARQGDMKAFSMSGGISPVTGNLLVEGPIVKNKASYLVSARSTYSDWLFQLIKNRDFQQSRASFSDGQVNLSFQLNEKNTLSLFSYGSYDDISLTGKQDYSYSNAGGAIRWGRIINKKHSLDNSLIYSQYSFEETNREDPLHAYTLPYALQHYEWRSTLRLRLFQAHQLSAGFNTIFYKIDQGKTLPATEESLIEEKFFSDEQALESAVFIRDEWSPLPRLSMTLGLRLNHFAYLGPKVVRKYHSEIRTHDNIADHVAYSDFELIRQHLAPDIRLAANYKVNPDFSLKAGVNQLHQHIFMLSNTIAAAPTFKWKLCDEHIKPLSGIQYSLGGYKNFLNGRYEFSAEGYIKQIGNFVDYRDGAEIALETLPETQLLQGDLNTYGIELMLKKPTGNFNGWLNYTYSRSVVKIAGPNPALQVNSGEAYPSSFDKPHALNAVASYRFGRRVSISSNMVYSTGRPITLPTAVYYQNGRQIVHYSKRNEYRVPDYFRFDISMKIEGNLKADKFAHSTWMLSVYNVTGRNNAYSVYFKTQGGEVNGYKMSIFAVPVVSLSYHLKLGDYADKYK